jgi:hypothetical protein
MVSEVSAMFVLTTTFRPENNKLIDINIHICMVKLYKLMYVYKYVDVHVKNSKKTLIKLS